MNSITKQIRKQVELIDNPVYVLDKELNIIGRVESKKLVAEWIFKNLNRTASEDTICRHCSSGKLYRGNYYFVEVENYEEFILSKKD